jgi:hypothetical protein
MSKGSINAEEYQRILAEHMGSIWVLYPDGFVFQQDNAPCHKARSTIEWLETEGYKVLDGHLFLQTYHPSKISGN